MVVEESSPDVPHSIAGAFLINLLELRSRGAKAVESFEWSDKELFDISRTDIREPCDFKVALTVKYFAYFIISNCLTIASHIHDAFFVFTWREEDVNAMDFEVELMVVKKGAYVGVKMTFKMGCVDTGKLE